MQPNYSHQGNFKIVPLSDRSVLVTFGNRINPSINEQVLSLQHALSLSAFEGFIESVPAYASLAVFYDLQQVKAQSESTAFAFVEKYLQSLLQTLVANNFPERAILKIPVCYGEEFGLDIIQLSIYYQLRVDEIIKLHTSVTYRVYMIGFMPGFAYMGSVPEKLIAPRKEQPRLQVPAGSVGIAGAQTGIYPVDSPGGWQIIGRTPLVLFDKNDASPCLLSAGDRVQFFSIDKNEFESHYVH